MWIQEPKKWGKSQKYLRYCFWSFPKISHSYLLEQEIQQFSGMPNVYNTNVGISAISIDIMYLYAIDTLFSRPFSFAKFLLPTVSPLDVPVPFEWSCIVYLFTTSATYLVWWIWIVWNMTLQIRLTYQFWKVHFLLTVGGGFIYKLLGFPHPSCPLPSDKMYDLKKTELEIKTSLLSSHFICCLKSELYILHLKITKKMIL